MLAETWQTLQSDWPRFFQAAGTHVALSAAALFAACLIAIPAGVALALHRSHALLAINLANFGRTVPSLAVLALVMPVLGTGFLPALFALVLLAIPAVLINTFAGVSEVDADTIDAARGIGLREREITRQVRLPLALPMIFAGIRTAAVQVISGATLAAYIGGGGLGEFITTGVAMMAMPMLLIGAVPATLLALLADAGFGLLQHAMTPRGMRTP